MPKIISPGALKGGVGKTMVLFNLAGLQAQNGKKVLLIDADPQANLTSNCGVNTADLERPSVKDIFEDLDIDPSLVVMDGVISELPGLDLIPSNIWLTKTEMTIAGRSNRENLLKNWIKRHEVFFSKYDYIMADSNPSMGLINKNVFAASDSIILVTDVGFNGVQGAEMFVFLWEEARRDLGQEDNIKALVINNVDKRIGLSRELQEYLEEEEDLAVLLVDTVVPMRVAMKNTELDRLPVTLNEKQSVAAEAIRNLTADLTKRGVF